MAVKSDLQLSTLFRLSFQQENCSIDELFFEKLLNEIKNAQINNPDLLRELDLCEICRYFIDYDLDHRLKSFGLRLIGLWIPTIPKMNENEIESINTLLLKSRQTIKKPTCQAVIKSSSLEMFKELIKNDEVKNIMAKNGIFSLSVTLMSESSIFICHEAELFLSQFLILYLPQNDAIAVDVFHHLLETFNQKSRKYFTHSISIFKRISETAFQSKIEEKLLTLLWEEEEEFICQKICEVLVVNEAIRKDYLKVDAIVKKLNSSKFINTAMKFCCDLLTYDLSLDLITNIQSYLLLAMDLLYEMNKSDKQFQLLISTLLKLNLTGVSDEFQVRYVHWFCKFVTQEQTEMPKIVLNVLDKLMDIYNFSKLNKHLEIVNVIIDIINSRMACDAVLMKSLKLYGILSKDFQSIDNIQKSISYLLYHPNWAVQDSVLELIAHFISGSPQCYNCILSNQLHRSVWEKLVGEVDESFITATALTTLNEIVKIPELWESLILFADEFKIMSKVINFLQNDFELVVRRAATKILFSLYRNRTLSSKWKVQIQSAMQQAIFDLDWEVKQEALEFWKHILSDVQSENYQELQQIILRLDSLGFCFAVINAVDDCDSTVKFEAASVLKSIQNDLKHFMKDNDPFLNVIKCDNENDNASMVEEMDICNPLDDGVMEAVLNTCDSEAVKSTVKLPLEQAVTKHDLNVRNVRLFGSHKFMNVLLELDLDKVQIDAETNSDIYEGNLELLVDDIVMMYKRTVDRDIIHDCY